MESLKLHQKHWDLMCAHVEACLPFEACGLVAGKGDSAEEVIPIANQLRSPTRFRMDPLEQIRAFDHMRAEAIDLLGIFHSHPAGPGDSGQVKQDPSATDIEEAAYPVVHIVWSRPNGEWRARGFWIENAGLSEVKLHIVKDA